MPVLLRALRAKDRRPRRSGAQRFGVGDDVIRCLVYRSALMNNFCGVTLSETRTVLQSSSSSSVTMKLVISDDFPFLQQGTGHEEIAQNSVSLESELSIFPPAAPCPFPSCLQPSRLYGSRPPRRSQPTARWTHSDLAMAQRMRASTRPAVLQLQPVCLCRAHALAPAFWTDMSQIATKRFLSSRWVPSIIVPAVTESWCGHLVHCHLCACPCTLEQVALPQTGHANPPGCLSSRSLLSHGSSSGNRSRRSISVPCSRIHACSARLHDPSPSRPPDLPDASSLHPHCAARRRREFLRLCRRSSVI